jgi:hypothetical protein
MKVQMYSLIHHLKYNYEETQEQEKCLYLKAHPCNALSSALSAEIQDKIKMEYSLLTRANLL